MRDTSRVQRDHALFYVFTAHEIAIDVVEHLIAVDVAMVVRRRDGLRVVVVQARHEGADYKVAGGKGLVHGGRLVHPAGDGLEVVNAESIGVYVAVPADQVEGVVEVIIGVHLILLFDIKQELPLLIVGL